MKVIGGSAIAVAVVAAAIGVFAATNLLTQAPPAADPNIQAKADQFSKNVHGEMESKAAAAADAKVIKLSVPKGRPLSVFYAGDSLSYSLFSSTEANGYRLLVNAELRKSGEILEQRATKADAQALFKVGNVESIPDTGIDLAIIELGTNDTARTEIGLFTQQYKALLDKVQRSAGVKIICAGAWGAGGSLGTDPYDIAIEKACTARGGQYIDLTATYAEKDTYGPKGAASWLGPVDDFHPNDKGHREIADLILERIKVTA